MDLDIILEISGGIDWSQALFLPSESKGYIGARSDGAVARPTENEFDKQESGEALQHRFATSPACYTPELPSCSLPSDPILANLQ